MAPDHRVKGTQHLLLCGSLHCTSADAFTDGTICPTPSSSSFLFPILGFTRGRNTLNTLKLPCSWTAMLNSTGKTLLPERGCAILYRRLCVRTACSSLTPHTATRLNKSRIHEKRRGLAVLVSAGASDSRPENSCGTPSSQMTEMKSKQRSPGSDVILYLASFFANVMARLRQGLMDAFAYKPTEEEAQVQNTNSPEQPR